MSRYFLLLVMGLVFAVQVSADTLTNKIQQLEQDLGGQIGLALLDVETAGVTGINHQSRFPLMSTFKPLACASLLLAVDNKRLGLDDPVIVAEAELVTYSPVIKKLVGKTLTLRQACEASILWSDNTAANIVLSHIGGPMGLTRFMQDLGDNFTRLDRIEPELNQALPADPRDSTTPNAMVMSLRQLLFGQVLSPVSRQQLKQWMVNTQNTSRLLRSILPDGWVIADKTGYGGNGSRGITAIVWPVGQSPQIIALYFTQTQASLSELNRAIVDIGQLLFAQISQAKAITND